MINRIKALFEENKVYLMEDVMSNLRITLYENLVKPPGEWDFLILLSQVKMIINIEVKKQVDMENRKKNQLNSSLRSASHQCESHADYAAEILAPLLSKKA